MLTHIHRHLQSKLYSKLGQSLGFLHLPAGTVGQHRMTDHLHHRYRVIGIQLLVQTEGGGGEGGGVQVSVKRAQADRHTYAWNFIPSKLKAWKYTKD